MSFSDGLNFGIEAIMGIFIFVIFFTAIAPTAIEFVNNNTGSIVMASAVVLLIGLFVVVLVMGSLKTHFLQSC
jgi:hypothetical protein